MERNTRRTLTGIVVSTAMEKTITVSVETSKKDAKYKKTTKSSKKYKAHDESNKANVGDKVTIIETRPLSATKRFRLLDIVEKAKI